MNYCRTTERRFCKDEKEEKKRVRGGKAKEEKGEVEDIGVRGKWRLQPCSLFLFKANPLSQVTTTPPSNRQN